MVASPISRRRRGPRRLRRAGYQVAEDAGVDDQGVAVRLHGLAFVAAVQDLAAVGVEDEPAQFVEGLAAVELAADAAAEGLVGEPAQRVRGTQQLTVNVLRDRLGVIGSEVRSQLLGFPKALHP